MSTSKREREAARRRHEKWLAHQQQRRAHRRRVLVWVGAIAGAAALVGSVALAVGRSGDPAPQPSAPSTPAASSSPSATDEPTAREVPDPSLAESRTWQSVLRTSAGDLTLALDGAAAPQAVASFVTLAEEGYFDDTSCHRLTVSGIYVLQCGDPTGTGSGGPGYSYGPIENAPEDDVYPAGTVAMARVGNQGESMGSQFFLVYADSTIPADSAGGYTVMGTITDGMDVLQAVADAGIADGTQQTPATEVTIKGVETE